MEEFAISIATWPEVPKDLRPRDLFVNYFVPKDLRAAVESNGWVIVDIRLLDKHKSISGLLEGMRLGSIPMVDVQSLNTVINFETKIEGLIGAKEKAPDVDVVKQQQSTSELLASMGTNKATRIEGAFKPKKKRAKKRSKVDIVKEKLQNG